MTEPDEALIWAREQGFPIYQHHTLARAYRAGQAASAERIKKWKQERAELLLEKGLFIAWLALWAGGSLYVLWTKGVLG